MEYIESTPDYRGLSSLAGRHVIVLGAGQGIGRQAAHAAASVGGKVSCVDLDEDRASSVADEIGGVAISGDVTDRNSMESIFAEAVDRLGPVRGLADIVGIAEWAPLVDISDDNWSRSLDLNLRHQFLAMQIGSRYMPDGGAMAFVASVSGQRSAPNHAIYGAAKAGLTNLVRTAALELAPKIRVNAVAPGVTLTPRTSVNLDADRLAAADAWVPLGRIGEARDIAAALLFFLTDQSDWVTGQTLTVDGGTSRKYQYDV
ncbi:short-chain dehydrogenase [Nocardia nova]|uniref:Short-chain dehydrogenase n=1 Tax=Nocardia nova TaxID=37330 RepID=A0A2S6AN02_9NOCA|nr:SDR family oxidoreductase [Nocardia nova]PPJ25756.1 short-chain dehydrogenase [Nocardia nova]PPJ36615.1 short-chain dehydrogenase [Nocardia nova]